MDDPGSLDLGRLRGGELTSSFGRQRTGRKYRSPTYHGDNRWGGRESALWNGEVQGRASTRLQGMNAPWK